MNTIDARWAAFRDAVLDEQPPAQVLLMRQAFYMGALATLQAFADGIEFGEAQATLLRRLTDEMRVHMALAPAAMRLAIQQHRNRGGS